MVGLGGVLVEALDDVVLAPVPLDEVGARALIGRLKAAAVFGRYRGLQPADTNALADLMVRLSRFSADHADEIDSIDLNPVIVHGEDALIIKRNAQLAERRGAAE